MNEINASASHLLSQIRTLGAALQPPVDTPAAQPAGTFGALLKDTIQSVNGAPQNARAMAIGFQNGTSDTNLAEVMIAAQKADLSFRAMTEVRNKLVSAYQDIMNMPV
jgi:flagellar hook-basal body complex protein FliE